MELVKDNHGDTRKIRIGQDAPGENPLRHDFNAGFFRDAAVKPDGVPQGLTDPLAQRLGHPPGCGDGGKLSGFQHEDSPLFRRDHIQERQRNPCGLAGAGRRLKNHGRMLPDGFFQLRQNLINGAGCQNTSVLQILLHAAKYREGGRSCQYKPDFPDGYDRMLHPIRDIINLSGARSSYTIRQWAAS